MTSEIQIETLHLFPTLDRKLIDLLNGLTAADNGTIVSMEIRTDIGGIWSIEKTDQGWILDKSQHLNPHAKVVMDPDTAWKLFSKSWKPEQVKDKVSLFGDIALAERVLDIVAVMA